MRNDNGTISGRNGGLLVYPSDPFYCGDSFRRRLKLLVRPLRPQLETDTNCGRYKNFFERKVLCF